MNTNTEFSYLYRDAANYKKAGTLIFPGLPVGGLERFGVALKAQFDEASYFIAGQVSVPEVFLWQGGYPVGEDNHCWHEFAGVSETELAATDPRTPEEFLAEVTAAATAGWREFNPA